MNLRVLNYFLAVAREQNISMAADILHITQPTLIRQLRYYAHTFYPHAKFCCINYGLLFIQGEKS